LGWRHGSRLGFSYRRSQRGRGDLAGLVLRAGCVGVGDWSVGHFPDTDFPRPMSDLHTTRPNLLDRMTRSAVVPWFHAERYGRRSSSSVSFAFDETAESSPIYAGIDGRRSEVDFTAASLRGGSPGWSRVRPGGPQKMLHERGDLVVGQITAVLFREGRHERAGLAVGDHGPPKLRRCRMRERLEIRHHAGTMRRVVADSARGG